MPWMKPSPHADRKIVEHDHVLAGVDEGKHHVAADVAGPASDKDGHSRTLADQPPAFARAARIFFARSSSSFTSLRARKLR